MLCAILMCSFVFFFVSFYFRLFVNSFVFCFVLRWLKPFARMDFEYFNSSTLSSLLGESTTTEKSNSDILNDTLQTFHKVISTKDMVSEVFAEFYKFK